MLANQDLIDEFNKYIDAHLAPEDWYRKEFEFINNYELREILIREFSSVRKFYRIFEAIGAENWLQITQCRMQVIMYASIYEAIVNYILFEEMDRHVSVTKLRTRKNVPKKISVPTHQMEKLKEYLSHDGKEIFPIYYGEEQIGISKIKFTDKIKCAIEIGIIDSTLGDEINDIYKARNSVHIEAELKKSTQFNLELSKIAYRRMRLFCNQIREFLKGRNIS